MTKQMKLLYAGSTIAMLAIVGVGLVFGQPVIVGFGITGMGFDAYRLYKVTR